MDNLNRNNSGGKEPNEPIPFDEEMGEPIPFDNDTGQEAVSHSPLSLGGGGTAGTTAQPDRPAAKKDAKIASSDRITGVRTFFTKLHPGAISFLDGQITDWLKSNPSIEIKRTNTTVGDVQSKKTEPNILVTVWY